MEKKSRGYSEAQARAIKNYKQKKAEVKILIEQEEKEELKNYSVEMNMSQAQVIREALKRYYAYYDKTKELNKSDENNEN